VLHLRITVCLCLIFLFRPLLPAQVNSRAEEIEAARARKAQNLHPDIPSKTERNLLHIKDNKIVERLTSGVAGFRVKLGGLVSGSGFALGPEYLRRDLAGGRLVLRSAAQGSLKGYQKYDFQFSAPRFARNRAFLDLYSVHRNFPGINYYGPGPDSGKGSRSDFRYEDTEFVGTVGLRPFRHLHLGVSLGYLRVNVGPGTDSRFISAEKIFTAAEAPGIDRQTDFLRPRAFAQFDYRDNPGGPRSGGNYIVQYSNYQDRTLNIHDFGLLDLEVQQYIPFFNKRRVIALRAKSVLTFEKGNQQMPFYLQPVLGGSDDLRGFRPFRFYDDNLIVVNAEYRWEVFSGLDMALFGDAGKVFARQAQWNFRNLEGSAGFGLRFNVRNDVFLRLDVGFSHEGFQVWVKFNPIFGGGPTGFAGTQSIF